MESERPRIYIGKLSNRTKESDLEDVFGKFGKVARVDMKQGYAFLFYEDVASAREAIENLYGHEIDGSMISVEMARSTVAKTATSSTRGKPELRIACSDLDIMTSWQDLKDWAREAGRVTFANVFTKDSQKCGVIEFETVDDVENAIRVLNDRPLRGATVRVFKDEGTSNDRDSHGCSSYNNRGRDRGDDRSSRYDRGGPTRDTRDTRDYRETLGSSTDYRDYGGSRGNGSYNSNSRDNATNYSTRDHRGDRNDDLRNSLYDSRDSGAGNGDYRRGGGGAYGGADDYRRAGGNGSSYRGSSRDNRDLRGARSRSRSRARAGGGGGAYDRGSAAEYDSRSGERGDARGGTPSYDGRRDSSSYRGRGGDYDSGYAARGSYDRR